MTALILALILGVPMCATEDSVSCVWVASIQGNGLGYDLWNDATGESHYLPNGIPAA